MQDGIDEIFDRFMDDCDRTSDIYQKIFENTQRNIVEVLNVTGKKKEELDKAIDEKFCERLNCKSDLDGYAKLLDLGGIKFDSGEMRNNMLKKVLANRDKILQRAAAQVIENNSNSSQGFFASIIQFVRELFFGQKKSAPTQSINKLSRKQVEDIWSILEQINKIFKSI